MKLRRVSPDCRRALLLCPFVVYEKKNHYIVLKTEKYHSEYIFYSRDNKNILYVIAFFFAFYKKPFTFINNTYHIQF